MLADASTVEMDLGPMSRTSNALNPWSKGRRSAQGPVGLIVRPRMKMRPASGKAGRTVSPVAGGWGDDQGSRNNQVAHAVDGNLPAFEHLAVNRIHVV